MGVWGGSDIQMQSLPSASTPLSNSILLSGLRQYASHQPVATCTADMETCGALPLFVLPRLCR